MWTVRDLQRFEISELRQGMRWTRRESSNEKDEFFISQGIKYHFFPLVIGEIVCSAHRMACQIAHIQPSASDSMSKTSEHHEQRPFNDNCTKWEVLRHKSLPQLSRGQCKSFVSEVIFKNNKEH